MGFWWYVKQWAIWLYKQPRRLKLMLNFNSQISPIIYVPTHIYKEEDFDSNQIKDRVFYANKLLEKARVQIKIESISKWSCPNEVIVDRYFRDRFWRQLEIKSKFLTIFICKEIKGKSGWHYPRMRHILLEERASSSTLAHEIAHAGDLWHYKDENNLLHPSPKHRKGAIWLSEFQQALLWSGFKSTGA
tara:strand:- start:484 stop:1050 length:567 start_codon:yes stop_codon:yes gene_type:complete